MIRGAGSAQAWWAAGWPGRSGCWPLRGLLVVFLAVALPVTALILAARALWRQQRAPSLAAQPSPLPERHRLADDPRVPLALVVAAAEAEAAASSLEFRSPSD